jgi:hypothetical protein
LFFSQQLINVDLSDLFATAVILAICMVVFLNLIDNIFLKTLGMARMTTAA